MKAYVVKPAEKQEGPQKLRWLLKWLGEKKRGGDIFQEGLVTGLTDEELEELRGEGYEVVDLEELR